jgi:hypothetical protein
MSFLIVPHINTHAHTFLFDTNGEDPNRFHVEVKWIVGGKDL